LNKLLKAATISAFCLLSSHAFAAEWRDKIHSFALENFKHPAWGFSHCQRDYDLSRQFASEDHVVLDDDILFAASFLHDIAAFPKWSASKVDHSDRGGEVAVSLLQEMGFPKEKLPAVRAAIETHMYYRKPVAPEALYLHDADAIDWLGAIGIVRAFALVGPTKGSAEARAAAEDLRTKLHDVPPQVFSKAGKAHLPAVISETETFLRNLKSQTLELKTL
jgi:HD superfamily phosphodiesterase